MAMLRIHSRFVGGNAILLRQTETEVYIKNELRDTEGDWFYWAFCVEGAENKTLTFHFEPNRLGYFGPAISHDLKEWHWLGRCEGDTFTYTFAQNESRVYFAHHILYHPSRFSAFARHKGAVTSELCISRKGRSVPCLHIGEGDVSLLLVARHHACESTGNYVLEGVLDELLTSPIPNTRILCIPFADYDGVLDGDQGKSRIPHDHNRDYIESPIYPEVRAICAHVAAYGCHYGFDFHSPWHKGGENDTMFIVRNSPEKQAEFDRFSTIPEASLTPDAMPYSKANDHPPLTSWNQPSTSFGYTMNRRVECTLAFSLESTYFGTKEHPVSTERLIAFGKCFAKAIRCYIQRKTT